MNSKKYKKNPSHAQQVNKEITIKIKLIQNINGKLPVNLLLNGEDVGSIKKDSIYGLKMPAGKHELMACFKRKCSEPVIISNDSNNCRFIVRLSESYSGCSFLVSLLAILMFLMIMFVIFTVDSRAPAALSLGIVLNSTASLFVLFVTICIIVFIIYSIFGGEPLKIEKID